MGNAPTLSEGEYIVVTPQGLKLMVYSDSNKTDYNIRVVEGHDLDVTEVKTEKATGSIWGKTTGGWAKLYDGKTGEHNAKTRSQIEEDRKAEEAARKQAEAEEARKQAEAEEARK